MKNNYVLRHNLTYYIAKLPNMCKIKHNWSIIGRNKLIENQEICSWSTKKNLLKLSAYQSGPKGTIEIIGIATFKKYQNDTTLVELKIGLGKLFNIIICAIILFLLYLFINNIIITLSRTNITLSEYINKNSSKILLNITLVFVSCSMFYMFNLNLIKIKSKIIIGTFEREFENEIIEVR